MGDRKLSVGAASMKKYSSKGDKKAQNAKAEKIKAGVLIFEGHPAIKVNKGDRLELATLEGKGIIRLRNWKGGEGGDIVFAMRLSECKRVEEPYSFNEKGASLSAGGLFGKKGRFLVLEGTASKQAVKAAFVISDPQAWISAFRLFPEFNK